MYPDWKEKQDNILDDADLVKNVVTNPQYGHIAEKILQVEAFVEKVNTAQLDNSYVLVSKEVLTLFMSRFVMLCRPLCSFLSFLFRVIVCFHLLFNENLPDKERTCTYMEGRKGRTCEYRTKSSKA